MSTTSTTTTATVAPTIAPQPAALLAAATQNMPAVTPAAARAPRSTAKVPSSQGTNAAAHAKIASSKSLFLF